MSVAVEPEQPRWAMGRPHVGSHAAEQSYNNDPMPIPGLTATRVSTATAVHRHPYHSLHPDPYTAMDDHDGITAIPGEHRPEGQAPVPPQKSALRVSRLLKNLAGLKLTMPVDPPAFALSPHDEYLSSEEEASSTTGDSFDFEHDSSSDDLICPSSSLTKDRRSHEDTARVISVVYSGKPSVVDVPQNRRSISPSSLLIERRQSLMDLGSQTSAYDSEAKRRRISVSTPSPVPLSSSSSSAPQLPQLGYPPQCSRDSPTNSNEPLQKTKLSFLQIDPYAHGSVYSLGVQPDHVNVIEDQHSRVPRTPTKMFKGVARTLSLMRRRSMPRMNQTFLSPSSENVFVPRSPSSHAIARESVFQEPEDMIPEESHEAVVPRLPSRLPPRVPPQQLPPGLSSTTHDETFRVAKENETKGKQPPVSRTVTIGLSESQTVRSPVSPLSTGAKRASVPAGNRTSSFIAARRRMSTKISGKPQA